MFNLKILHRSLLSALHLIFLSAGGLYAQDTQDTIVDPSSTEDASIDTSKNPSESEQQFVQVAALESIQANQQFQQNLQVIEQQRRNAFRLKQALDNAESDQEKNEIQKNLDNVMKNLNENNQKMLENYGFTLNRNYTMVMDKVHVYMRLSKEELEDIKKKANGSETGQSK